MFALVALLVFSNGSYSHMHVHNFNKASECVEGGKRIMSVKVTGWRVIAYKCEQEV